MFYDVFNSIIENIINNKNELYFSLFINIYDFIYPDTKILHTILFNVCKLYVYYKIEASNLDIKNSTEKSILSQEPRLFDNKYFIKILLLLCNDYCNQLINLYVILVRQCVYSFDFLIENISSIELLIKILLYKNYIPDIFINVFRITFSNSKKEKEFQVLVKLLIEYFDKKSNILINFNKLDDTDLSRQETILNTKTTFKIQTFIFSNIKLYV